MFFTASDVPGTVTFTFKRKKRVRTVTVPIEDGIAEFRWRTPPEWPRGKTRVTATYVPSAGSRTPQRSPRPRQVTAGSS